MSWSIAQNDNSRSSAHRSSVTNSLATICCFPLSWTDMSEQSPSQTSTVAGRQFSRCIMWWVIWIGPWRLCPSIKTCRQELIFPELCDRNRAIQIITSCLNCNRAALCQDTTLVIMRWPWCKIIKRPFRIIRRLRQLHWTSAQTSRQRAIIWTWMSTWTFDSITTRKSCTAQYIWTTSLTSRCLFGSRTRWPSRAKVETTIWIE